MTLEELQEEVKALRADVDDLMTLQISRSSSEILLEMKPFSKDNSLFRLIGIGSSGKGDISTNKHRYLIESGPSGGPSLAG
ncbi:MAG: hypothetical protein IT210_10380 [Armatimonadetes bacterium]|nr:hypothetical protein [Armatimonadota bacterium]